MQPYEIKKLSNGTFITNNSSSVSLFDESFKQLKKIDISGRAIGCAIHNDKGIYISDNDNHCIYLMDNEFNIVKTFGSRGSGMDGLFFPRTICCQNEYLFVSDFGNKRIQILTLDLKYHQIEFQVNEEVMLFWPVRKVGFTQKLLPRWDGPYRIVKRLSPVTYRIEKGNKNLVVHVQRLRHYEPWLKRNL